ncbi:MAG: SAM hydrolase/SAM-dependent halogenase family protein [Candidatus Njordarchaeales archaeon]
MEKPIIALLTDFGYSDGYVGAMKGVILSINPEAIIVDLAHNLPKFNIRYAAFVLYSTFDYFPLNTIFVGVIDPGVGTAREPIIMRTKRYFFVGPNNGLFSLVLEKEELIEVRKIENPKYMLPKVSTTFHGRDIFAPAAAYLSKGVPVESFGSLLPSDAFIRIPYKVATIDEQNHTYIGEILAIDSFGNVITNIPGDAFLRNEKYSSKFIIEIRGHKHVTRFVKTYGEGSKGELILLIGSHDFVEIAINQGSAKDRIRANEGNEIIITRIE